MSAAEKIRPEDMALSALEIAPLFGLQTDSPEKCKAAKRYVLERLTVLPSFPTPCTPPGMRKAWNYAEVLEWRELNRVLRPTRRR